MGSVLLSASSVLTMCCRGVWWMAPPLGSAVPVIPAVPASCNRCWSSSTWALSSAFSLCSASIRALRSCAFSL